MMSRTVVNIGSGNVVMVRCLTAPSHFLNSTDLSSVMTMYIQNTNVSFNETGTTLLFSAK